MFWYELQKKRNKTSLFELKYLVGKQLLIKFANEFYNLIYQTLQDTKAIETHSVVSSPRSARAAFYIKGIVTTCVLFSN